MKKGNGMGLAAILFNVCWLILSMTERKINPTVCQGLKESSYFDYLAVQLLY